MELRVRVITWNAGNAEAIGSAEIKKLLYFHHHEQYPVDIFVIGFQEIPTGALETAMSFLAYDQWAKALTNVLCKQEYYLLESVRLQGLSLSVFAHIRHLPFMRFVRVGLERTGALRGNWGNKGAVAVSVWAYGKKLCLLNTHLAAHDEQCDTRVEQFKTCVHGITFGDTTTVLNHDCTIWLGDTNFRLNEISRDDVIQAVNANQLDKLLCYDQLKDMQTKEELLGEFREADITFDPTYKFDDDCDVYDTSEKQRKPAWTDRILIRIHPDHHASSHGGMKIEKGCDQDHKGKLHIHLAQQMQKTSLASPRVEPPLHGPDPTPASATDSDDAGGSSRQSFSSATSDAEQQSFVRQVAGSYASFQEFRHSDHRPVATEFLVQVEGRFEKLITLVVEGSCHCTEAVIVRMIRNDNLVQREDDYLALYEYPLRDFRDYKEWTYVPFDYNRASDTSCRFPDIEQPGRYVIGYYSEKISSLIGVTPPFTMSA